MNNIIQYKFLILAFLFISLISIESNAQQNNCAFKLEEAESLYEAGIFDSIPSMLRPCIDNGFENEELSRAYKLLILIYLFEDYQEMAELTMNKFLKKFPEYELKANDPVEFAYLHKSYKTIPIYSIGLIGGVNYSFVRVIEPYSLDNTGESSGEYSAAGVGYQVGLQIKRYINEKIELNVDGIYTVNKFNYTAKQLDSKIVYDESQTLLSFPITGTYGFKFKNLDPYLRLGFSIDYRTKATASIERSFEGGAVIREDLTGPELDIIDDRSKINFSAVIGGGIKYKTKRGYFMLDLRYNLGFLNNVNKDNRYANDEKIWYYNYVDDDFTLNNLYISLGYVYSFYKTVQSK